MFNFRTLWAASLIAAFVSMPAMAQKIQTDYDHKVNFSQDHNPTPGERYTPPTRFLKIVFVRRLTTLCNKKGGVSRRRMGMSL